MDELKRFPLAPDNDDRTFIAINNTIYAKFNKIGHSEKRQRGFLTEHTLFFIVQGKKKFHFDDQAVTVNENEIILVKRGIYTVSEQLSRNGSFEALMLFVPEGFVQQHHGTTSNSVSSFNRHFLKVEKNQFITDFQKHYFTLFGKDLTRFESLLHIRLQEALTLFMIAGGTDAKKMLGSLKNLSSVDSMQVIKAHLLEQLTIDDLAKLSYKSVSAFTRDVKRKSGMSPKKWINLQRLNYAKSVFENSDKSVQDIALECGFESTSHFIKIFRQQFGFTPNRIKNAMK